MVAAGIVGISIADMHWRWRIAMLLLPMVAYAALVFRRKFPVHERVAAGVSYKEMLKETGGIGMLLVLLMMFGEVGRVLGWHWGLSVGLAVGISVVYTWYTRSLGQPLFLFLLVVMIPLATTELGTDSWITELMKGPMKELGANAAWLLVYTSAIMMILRFCAGPIVKALSPLGLLLASSAIASVGLIALSKSAGVTILLAATLYGVGKTYFWPTMLGIVAEIFPRGGALSLNVTSAVGMMSVGVVGTVFLGLVQDNAIESRLRQDQPGLHAKLVVEKQSVVGAYQAVAPERVKDLPGDQQQIVNDLTVQANKGALATVALLPAAMFLGYLGLVILFRLRGGYRVVQLTKPGDQEGSAPPPAPPRA